MRPDDLKALRVATRYTQLRMAKEMGLALRSYQELESGEKPIRSRHISLAERISLKAAVQKQDPSLALSTIRDEAMAIAKIILNYEPDYATEKRIVIAAIDQGIDNYKKMLGEKVSGRRFAEQIQDVLVAICNAIRDLDHRAGKLERRSAANRADRKARAKTEC